MRMGPFHYAAIEVYYGLILTKHDKGKLQQAKSDRLLTKLNQWGDQLDKKFEGTAGLEWYRL